ncbi:hypothetical protein Golob_007500 [Gossypium lobatum]|uniref:DUF4283 domain-containing protein n=1 Tax=Gossypium lobatum TaxID=34289 RepID=A0A7J8MCJ6_9ROSI|nr:hypothetical protein [Gossypium lobatum]
MGVLLGWINYLLSMLFKDMLVGHMNRSELGWKSFEEDDSQLIEGDVFIGTEDGLSSIRFSDRVWQILYKNMSKTVVVKLLGRKVGYQTLSNRIYHLWKPSTPISILDLENDYFMIKFQSKVDYFKALTEGSWAGFGQHLTVHPWTELFSMEQPFLSDVVA